MHPTLRALVHRTPPRLRGGVELVLRTGYDTVQDRAHGLAAEVAFFVILSVPPLLVTVLIMATPIGQLFDVNFAADLEASVEAMADNVFTATTMDDVISPAVRLVTSGQTRPDLGVLTVLVALWAASRAMKVILGAIINAYDLEPTRPGWQQRLLSLGMTVVGMVLGLVVVPIMVAGPRLGEIVSIRLGINAGLGTLWRLGYWPGVVLTATSLIATLYHYGTPWTTPWRRDLPGAVLAMVIWVGGSGLLRVYTTQSIGGGDSLYGPVAGPVVVLIWIWVSAFALLVGAELNAEIEKMWPASPQKGPDPVPDRIVPPGQPTLVPAGQLPLPSPAQPDSPSEP